MTVGEAAEILDGEEDGSNRPRTADSGIFARRLPDGTALMRDEELAKAFRTLVENWTNQSITFHESTEQVRGIKTTAAASTHKRLSPSDINPIRAALDIAEAMLVLSGKDGWNHTDRAAARVIESIRLLRDARMGAILGAELPEDPAKVMNAVATKLRHVADEWMSYWSQRPSRPQTRHLEPDDKGMAAELLRVAVARAFRFRKDARSTRRSDDDFAMFLAHVIWTEAHSIGDPVWHVLPKLKGLAYDEWVGELTGPSGEVIGDPSTDDDDDLAERVIVACAKVAGCPRPSALFDARSKQAKRVRTARRRRSVRTN